MMTPVIGRVLGRPLSEADMAQWTKGLELTPDERRRMEYVNQRGRQQFGHRRWMGSSTQSTVRSSLKADPRIRQNMGLETPPPYVPAPAKKFKKTPPLRTRPVPPHPQRAQESKERLAGVLGI